MYQHDIQFFTATILWWKHPQLGIGYAYVGVWQELSSVSVG